MFNPLSFLHGGCRTLTRLLLESNPLKPTALADLISDLSRTSRMNMNATNHFQSSGSEKILLWDWPFTFASFATFACCFREVLPVTGGQISLKLTRASQLRRPAVIANRRDGIRSVAEPMGPPDPLSQPAALLIVAFTASQETSLHTGEPEWLGFLRRLLELGEVQLRDGENRSREASIVKDVETSLHIARLWSNCPREFSSSTLEAEPYATRCNQYDCMTWQRLTVVDHRMRWYNEDRAHLSSRRDFSRFECGTCQGPALERALKDLRPKYSKIRLLGSIFCFTLLFFEALLHGGSLADGVVAFNPQATLTEALLRPPAESSKDLEDGRNTCGACFESAASRETLCI
eukprot:Skav216287  [mRNA]  locus=scaffold494:6093:10767:- [translate_table: standard]